MEIGGEIPQRGGDHMERGGENIERSKGDQIERCREITLRVVG